MTYNHIYCIKDQQTEQYLNCRMKCIMWLWFTVLGPNFRKVLWWTCEKHKKKTDLWKTKHEHVIIKKSYKYLMKNLERTYEKITTALQVSYENVKSRQVMSFGKPSVRGCYWWNILG